MKIIALPAIESFPLLLAFNTTGKVSFKELGRFLALKNSADRLLLFCRQKLISLTLSNGKVYFPYELFESKKDFYENRRYLLRKQIESDEVLLNIKEKELEIIKSRLEEFKKELEAEEHRNVKSCSHRL